MKRFLPVVFLSLLALWACATKPAPDKTCYPKVVVLKGVNFDFNKSVLKPESYTALNENLATLASRPKMTITIIGHTDSDGNEAYNQKLSFARATAVMQYFAEKGIAANRMQAVGKGESTPIADNRTESGKALNRRIEIEFNDPEPDIICK
ncbi:MAG TPA: OmpA family protein [Syntrophorhabdaceae bacterium]|nr:OmpA family protein [Syntrophorhabdaceae bacterium]